MKLSGKNDLPQSGVDIQEIILLLKACKHEHWFEPMGLIACCYPDTTCNCGAAEINDKIDAMTARLAELDKPR